MGKGNFIEKEIVGINGLDLCAIMGVSKNRTLYDVYSDKTSCENSTPKKIEVSEASYWDYTIKEMIAKEYSLRSGKKVRKENKLLIDEEYDFIIGNIDRRVVGENSILICKTENTFSPIEWVGEELPDSYVLECQHYMRIANAEKCYIASLISGRKFVYKEVLRDENVINMIVEVEKDFWINNVLKRVPPKTDKVYI